MEQIRKEAFKEKEFSEEQYDQMMESYCPPERLYDTSYTFSSLQESNAYDM